MPKEGNFYWLADFLGFFCIDFEGLDLLMLFFVLLLTSFDGYQGMLFFGDLLGIGFYELVVGDFRLWVLTDFDLETLFFSFFFWILSQEETGIFLLEAMTL